MKKILGIALIMALTAGCFSANAQTQTTPKKEKTEQHDKARKDKKSKHDKSHKRHGKVRHADLFAGINLTAEQKAQLDGLKPGFKPKDEANKAPKAAKNKDAKATKNKDAKAAKNKEAHQARRAEYNAKVKEILTPDQWAVYQQNVEKMKAKRHKKNA